MAMLITDPSQEDNPVIFANRAFRDLTGYEQDEALGRNCRFLQGPDTDPDARAKLKACIEAHEDLHIEILNYRKDGSTFWNSLFVSPVRDSAGQVIYYFASQLDVTERKSGTERTRRWAGELAAAKQRLESEVAAQTEELLSTLEAKTRLLDELDHRVKNNLQLMISLINLEKHQRISESERQALDVIGLRLQALGLVHRRLYSQGVVDGFAIAEFVHEIAHELQAQSGRRDIQLGFDVEDVAIPAGTAGPIALLINELVGAALRFAYQGRNGRLKLSLRDEGHALEFALGGCDYTGLEKQTVEAAVGGVIVSSLARQLDAAVDWKESDSRSLVAVTIPRAAEAADDVLRA
jgi:PAS domain S-box-containing protein